jgi:hypothetical protein
LAKPWCCDISSQQGNTKLRSNQMKLRGMSEMSKSEIFISWFNDLNLTVMHAKHIKSKRWLMVFGFGVTYWPLAPIFVSKEDYWTEKLRLLIQADMDYLLQHIPRVRRLRMATGEQLNYSLIGELVNLRKLIIQSPVMDEPDLSKMKKLRYLEGRDPSIQNVQGLSELEKLKYVEIPFPKQKFLKSLPTSVKSLFLQMRLPKSLNLSHLVNLKTLTLHSMNKLDFSTLKMECPSVKTLRLYDIKNMTNQHLITKIFPGLELIVCQVKLEEKELLRKRVDSKVNIRQTFWTSF